MCHVLDEAKAMNTSRQKNNCPSVPWADAKWIGHFEHTQSAQRCLTDHREECERGQTAQQRPTATDPGDE